MSIQVSISSYKDYEKFQKRVRITKAAMPSHQLYLLHDVAEGIVLEPIHDFMRSANVSEKIINGTKITRVELINKRKGRVWIVSMYFAGSFDVALARHEGTQTHKIMPKQNRPNPHLRFFDKAKGEVIYSSGHKVKGLPKLKYIDKIIQQKRGEFPDQYNLELKVWIEKMLEVKTKIVY